MKSPWKLIGQLFSDRKVPAVSQAPADTDSKSSDAVQDVASTIEPSVVSVALSSGGPVPEGEEGVQHQVDARRTDNAFEAETKVDVAPALKSTPRTSEEGLENLVSNVPRPRRGLRPRQDKPTKQTVRQPDPVEMSVPAEKQADFQRNPVSFDDQVAKVEAEVRALRRQLSERLKLQNDQLRQMLERFGGR